MKHQEKITLPADVVMWKLSTIARALNLSKRTLERKLSIGEFPRPDLRHGQVALWRRETVENWIERWREVN